MGSRGASSAKTRKSLKLLEIEIIQRHQGGTMVPVSSSFSKLLLVTVILMVTIIFISYR